MKQRRGYVLAEVLVAGAVLLWAMSGILAGLDQGNAQLGTSLKEQQANALAQQRVEQLNLTSTAQWTGLSGTTSVEPDAGGLFGWTRTTVYAAVQVAPVSWVMTQPVPLLSATVTVTSPAGTTAVRTAQKWQASW